jgi:hypothetical protein
MQRTPAALGLHVQQGNRLCGRSIFLQCIAAACSTGVAGDEALRCAWVTSYQTITHSERLAKRAQLESVAHELAATADQLLMAGLSTLYQFTVIDDLASPASSPFQTGRSELTADTAVRSDPLFAESPASPGVDELLLEEGGRCGQLQGDPPVQAQVRQLIRRVPEA